MPFGSKGLTNRVYILDVVYYLLHGDAVAQASNASSVLELGRGSRACLQSCHTVKLKLPSTTLPVLSQVSIKARLSSSLRGAATMCTATTINTKTYVACHSPWAEIDVTSNALATLHSCVDPAGKTGCLVNDWLFAMLHVHCRGARV